MVQYLLDNMTPIAVIGMPEDLFKTSGKGGTHTKVCLLVAEKRPAAPDDEIFMAEARWCGHDSRGRALERDDLPEIVRRFHRFRAGDPAEASNLGFGVPVADVRDSVLAPRYYDPEPRSRLRALERTHELVRLGDLEKEGHLSITTGHEVGKLAYGTGEVPFVRTSDLSNWEIKVDPKHCVDRRTYEALAPRQDVRAGDLLMVRDGTYLIGTCAMVTRHDEEIIIQSHLLKIRAGEGAPFDTYFLLAALSTPAVRSDAERLRALSSKVRRVIDDRIEARELAREVVREVAAVE